MGEPLRDRETQDPYPASLLAARHEAIIGIGQTIFRDIMPGAQGEENEVTIGPDDVIKMTEVVTSSLEAQRALRDRVNIVPSDVPGIVDDIITIFRSRQLIEGISIEE